VVRWVIMDTGRSEMFDQLEDELRLALVSVPTVLAKVISNACQRLPNLSHSGSFARLDTQTET
jgi:hypothetical protein